MTDIFTTTHPFTSASEEELHDPKIVNLGNAQDLGIKVNKIIVKDVKLAADYSGDWTIELELPPIRGIRNNDPSVSVREAHQITCLVKVTRQEIADHEGIPVEDVRSTLTLEQTETIITSISLAKVLPVFNLTL
jgi:hypothetical protein